MITILKNEPTCILIKPLIVYNVLVCLSGYYGTDCSERCSSRCINDGACDHVSGVCSDGCKDGYTGKYCNNCKKSTCIDQDCVFHCF